MSSHLLQNSILLHSQINISIEWRQFETALTLALSFSTRRRNRWRGRSFTKLNLQLCLSYLLLAYLIIRYFLVVLCRFFFFFISNYTWGASQILPIPASQDLHPRNLSESCQANVTGIEHHNCCPGKQSEISVWPWLRLWGGGNGLKLDSEHTTTTSPLAC